jgi:hypothetical protein
LNIGRASNHAKVSVEFVEEPINQADQKCQNTPNVIRKWTLENPDFWKGWAGSSNGTSMPQGHLPELLAQLKTAGSDKVFKEQVSPVSPEREQCKAERRLKAPSALLEP